VSVVGLHDLIATGSGDPADVAKAGAGLQ